MPTGVSPGLTRKCVQTRRKEQRTKETLTSWYCKDNRALIATWCVTTVLQGMSTVWDCWDRLSSTLSKIQNTVRKKRGLNSCVSIHLDQHPILHPANVINLDIAVPGQHLALQPSQSPPNNVTLQSSEGAHRPVSMDLPVVDIHLEQWSPCWSRCYHQQQVNATSRRGLWLFNSRTLVFVFNMSKSKISFHVWPHRCN